MSSSQPPSDRAISQNVTRCSGRALKTPLLAEWVYAGHAEVAGLGPARTNLLRVYLHNVMPESYVTASDGLVERSLYVKIVSSVQFLNR